jgi:hypothetical protein
VRAGACPALAGPVPPPPAEGRGGAPRGPVRYNDRVADPQAWTLISILLSTIPLEASLAATLHEAALDLYRRDAGVGQVGGDLVTGRVVNLKKTLQLGAITGPAFEAKLETARGSGTVRYLLTSQGLEREGLAAARSPAHLLD